MFKNKKTQEKKVLRNRKTAALFNDLILKSNELFIHCIRIPDVALRVAKARDILKKYKVKPPKWMFGLTDKGETFDSPSHLKLMSFLISLGLYDRMLRLIGPPDFLIGSSRALLVSAKVGTFEKNVIQIFCGIQHDSHYLSLYKKKKDKIPRFTLLHFSEQSGQAKQPKKHKKNTVQSLAKMYNIDRLILVSPSPTNHTNYELKKNDTVSTVEGLIEMDSNLAWLWLILKRKQLAKSRRFTPGFFSLDRSF